MTGDTTGAQRWLRGADELACDIPRIYASQAEVNRAMVIGSGGDTRRALDVALRAAKLARESGQLTQEAYALHIALRHGASRDVSERLTELAGRTDSELTAAFADAARAKTRRDGLALDEVVSAFEALDSPLMAAESAFAAGYAHRRSGESRRATIAFERARLLAGRCPGARTVSLAATDTAATLTERERQIAWLAASGMSSNDIARRLNLSVRTIDNRLGHVYTKLGISGLVELVEILSPHKPDE